MLLQPVFEGSEDNPPALGFGCVLTSDQIRVPVLWVGLEFECSSMIVKLHKNETEFSTLNIAWIKLDQGVHEGVIFDVIQD